MNVEFRDAEVKKLAQEADGFFAAATSPAKLPPSYDDDSDRDATSAFSRRPEVNRVRYVAPRAGSQTDLSPTTRPAYSTGMAALPKAS